MAKTNFNPDTIKNIIIDSVENILSGTYGVTFSSEPEFAEKEIIEYDSRMRVFGLEKFNEPCYVAAVNFFENEQKKKDDKTFGVVVLYVEDSCASKMLKAVTPKADDDDIEALLGNTGDMCSALAADIKKRITQKLGFPSNIVLSDPIKEKNDIVEGVNFEYEEEKYYEVIFFVKKEKAVAVVLSLAAV